MSHYLLAIELLLACLLYAALMFTAALRRERRWVRALIGIAGLFLPLIPLGFLLLYAMSMRFAAGIVSPLLPWAICLMVGYVIGAGAVRWVVGRRDATGIRRSGAWPTRRIASSLLVVVALMGMTLWNMELRAEIEVQALCAQAGSLALSIFPPQVAESANAAPIYELVDARYKTSLVDADEVKVDGKIDHSVDYLAMDPRSPEVKTFLERQAKTLELLRRAADLPDCRPDYDYLRPDMQAIIDQMKGYRFPGANLLNIAARAESAGGNTELALDDCRRIVAVGGHVSSTPMLITALVTLAIDNGACKATAEVLPFVTKKEQLDHLIPPDPAPLARLFNRALRGEEAYSLATFCDLAEAKTSTPVMGVPSGPGAQGGIAIWMLWIQGEVGTYQDLLHRVQAISLRPFYQTVVERKAILEESEPGKRRGLMTTILLPSISKSLALFAEGEAMRSAVGVAVAATRYRLDHGQYPDTADLLIPGYLESIPLDPMDGKSLRFKKLENGWLAIYSIGSDGIDNGGDVEGKEGKKGADVGIVLRIPAH